MAKRLTAHTHAIDGQGRTVHFAPGDTVPDWAMKQLTNPKLWTEDDGQPAAPESPADPPSRSGPGSGKDAWAAFAAAHHVQVPDGATRDDIITACEAAGVISPEG